MENIKNDLFLSLGSNIEPKIDNLTNAINLLNKEFHLKRLSYVYQTEPQDDIDQAYFYNICAFYQTEIEDPFLILQKTQQIEKELGRVKDISRPKGPRLVDIDIILFRNIEISTEILSIPHKSMKKRNFVLIPLLEILNNHPIYIKEYDLRRFIKENDAQIVKKISELKIERHFTN